MYRIAKFEKVSFEQFKKDYIDACPQLAKDDIKEIYDAIKLPKRATAGSAGYDFYAPFPIVLQPGSTTKIPTGIRARIDNGWVLKLYPRSGLGFKFRMQLNNTVGIIDSDYYGSDNEGHILWRRLQMIQMKQKRSLLRLVMDLCKEFLLNTELLRMMMPMGLEMADSGLQRQIRRSL